MGFYKSGEKTAKDPRRVMSPLVILHTKEAFAEVVRSHYARHHEPLCGFYIRNSFVRNPIENCGAGVALPMLEQQVISLWRVFFFSLH